MVPLFLLSALIIVAIFMSIVIGVMAEQFQESPRFTAVMIIAYVILFSFLSYYHAFKQEVITSKQTVDIQIGDEDGAKYSFIEYRDYNASTRRIGEKIYMTHKFPGIVNGKTADVTQWRYETPIFFGCTDTDIKVNTYTDN